MRLESFEIEVSFLFFFQDNKCTRLYKLTIGKQLTGWKHFLRVSQLLAARDDGADPFLCHGRLACLSPLSAGVRLVAITPGALSHAHAYSTIFERASFDGEKDARAQGEKVTTGKCEKLGS